MIKIRPRQLYWCNPRQMGLKPTSGDFLYFDLSISTHQLYLAVCVTTSLVWPRWFIGPYMDEFIKGFIIYFLCLNLMVWQENFYCLGSSSCHNPTTILNTGLGIKPLQLLGNFLLWHLQTKIKPMKTNLMNNINNTLFLKLQLILFSKKEEIFFLTGSKKGFIKIYQ